MTDNGSVRSPWQARAAGTVRSVRPVCGINLTAQILELRKPFKQIASISFIFIVLETQMKTAMICPSINKGSKRKTEKNRYPLCTP